jgi:hypothetical protein
VLSTGESAAAFKQRMRGALADRLPPHMIPLRVEVAQQPLFGERMKKLRRPETP